MNTHMIEQESLLIVSCNIKIRNGRLCDEYGNGYSYCVIKSIDSREGSNKKKSFYKNAEKNSG